MQWSSQSWECSGLEQVSAQGEPHSRYCMLRGQVWAAGQSAGPRHVLPPPPGQGGDTTGPGPARALTAEVGAPPVLGPSPRVGALAGILREGGTWAGRAAAEVLGAGGHVLGGIHQRVALGKGLAKQGAAADALLGSTGVRCLWGRLQAGPLPP